MHRIKANGAHIPAIGFGTWTLKNAQARDLVDHAISSGYRHIDTAAMYDNEKAVGEGIRASGVARGELFLTSKVWHTELSAVALKASAHASLERLASDYIDLFLVHWPSSTGVALEETIAALNEVQKSGIARHIGVSNFPSALLARAAVLSEAPLACNQVEYHPYLNQDTVLNACRDHKMALVSYCPLGRGTALLEDQAVVAAAERTGKSPAQIVLRWHIQQDSVVAIPRSQNRERIAQNIDLFDFELSESDMSAISARRSVNHRICNFDFSPAWD